MTNTLEIKTSILLKLDFANNTILSLFFLFFLIIDLYFLITAVLTQIFNAIAELTIAIGIPTKEPKATMETHTVTVEIKLSKFSI